MTLLRRSHGGTASIFYGEAAIRQVERLCVAGRVPVFSSAPWVVAAWDHLPELGSPAVVTARNGAAIWALPVSLRRSHHRVVITLAGAPLGDEHDLAGPARLAPRSVAARAVGCLVDACWPGGAVELDALDGTGSLAGCVKEARDEWRIEHDPAPVIVSAGAIVPLSHERRWRRLAHKGRLELQIVEGALLNREVIEGFLQRRLERWMEQGRLDDLPAVERAANFPSFLGEAVTRLALAAQARMWVLLLDGEAVAEDLHLGPARRPLLYMRNYASRVGASSPGRLLLEKTLLVLRGAGVKALRTGRGDEPYKMAVGGGSDQVVNARLVVRPCRPIARPG